MIFVEISESIREELSLIFCIYLRRKIREYTGSLFYSFLV